MLFRNLINLRNKILKTAQKQNCDSFYYGNFIPNPNSKVMFVAEMPSSRKYDPYLNFQISANDLKFTTLLSKYGFGGSYLTDVVKTATIARRPTETEVNTFRDILIKEIEYLNPSVLVAVGESAEKELFQILSGSNISLPIKRIHHPAWCRRTNKWDVLEKDLVKLSEFA